MAKSVRAIDARHVFEYSNGRENLSLILYIFTLTFPLWSLHPPSIRFYRLLLLSPSAPLQLVDSVGPEMEGVCAKSLDPTPAHPPIPPPTLHHASLIIHVHRDSFHLIYYFGGGTADCCAAPSPLDL